MKILEEKIIQHISLEKLAEEGNNLIKEGWQPLGDVRGFKWENGTGYFHQTFVKYEENSVKETV